MWLEGEKGLFYFGSEVFKLVQKMTNIVNVLNLFVSMIRNVG